MLYVIQDSINCLPTMDYFFTNIKPAPIIVTCPEAHQNKSTPQQAATRDPISQQTYPSQPGKTRVYPSMLTNKQVPVLNLTETSITSQAHTFVALLKCQFMDRQLLLVNTTITITFSNISHFYK